MRDSFKEKVEKTLFADGNDPEPRSIFYDEDSQKELLLFIRKGYTVGPMTIWFLDGICETKDYEESMEVDGRIKKWLEIEIED